MQRPIETNGFCEIVLDRGRNEANLGVVWRTAGCYGIAGTGQIGTRYKRLSSDVLDTYNMIPHRTYLDADEWAANGIPYATEVVAVEILDDAIPLAEFKHPAKAVYVFGPEDGSIQPKILEHCQHKVFIPTNYCLNQATTVGTVLYDRQAKLGKV